MKGLITIIIIIAIVVVGYLMLKGDEVTNVDVTTPTAEEVVVEDVTADTAVVEEGTTEEVVE